MKSLYTNTTSEHELNTVEPGVAPRSPLEPRCRKLPGRRKCCGYAIQVTVSSPSWSPSLSVTAHTMSAFGTEGVE
eukprot:1033399-Prymnesium_polylepis.1